MLIIGQVSLLLFAAILAFIPQYYLVVFIVYLAFILAISVAMQRRGSKGDKNRVLSGRILFKEEKAMEIAFQDKELMEELSAQTKLMSISFGSIFIALAVFWLFGVYKDSIISILAGYVEGSALQLFLYWLIVFETIFLINRVLMYLLMRGKKVQQPLMPNKYFVTDKGIASPGFGGVTFEFPLPENVSVSVNERRKYVEIVLDNGRKVRLYTKNPRRLYDLILSLNERAKKRSSGKVADRGRE